MQQTLLVVEGDPALRDICKKPLVKHGYLVETAPRMTQILTQVAQAAALGVPRAQHARNELHVSRPN